jgi:HAD superfamily hydrolase (TIGR01549 family)
MYSNAISLYCDGLRKLFSILITEEDTVHHKPDPRVFEKPIKRLEALGVLRSDITYIGDSLGDATAARRAELRFCGNCPHIRKNGAFSSA